MRNSPKTRRPTGASRKSSTRSTRSSRTSRSSGREQDKETRRGKKSPKKQDNTMLFVGIGVGVFVLLIIIIAAASGGGGSAPRNNNYTNNQNNTQKPYVLPLNVRQEIYKRYMQGVDQFERERMQAMESLSGDEIRKKGPLLQAEKQTKETITSL